MGTAEDAGRHRLLRSRSLTYDLGDSQKSLKHSQPGCVVPGKPPNHSEPRFFPSGKKQFSAFSAELLDLMNDVCNCGVSLLIARTSYYSLPSTGFSLSHGYDYDLGSEDK